MCHVLLKNINVTTKMGRFLSNINAYLKLIGAVHEFAKFKSHTRLYKTGILPNSIKIYKIEQRVGYFYT